MPGLEPERVAAALKALDPASRALVELSLRRGMPDHELGEVLGISESDVRKRREDAIRRIGSRVGRDDPGGLAEVRAALEDAPPGAAGLPGRAAPDRAPTAHIRSRPAAFLRENSLSLFFLAIFLAALVGQAVSGHRFYNEEAVQHDSETISLGRYLTSSDFGQAVLENWQSEYLQFLLYVMATVWFVQRGSPESKEPQEAGLESDEKQLVGSHAGPESPRWARVGGLRTRLYSNSLLIVMGTIFVASWFGQSVTGWSEFSSEQLDHGDEALSWVGYLGSSHFWTTSLQNWQSEFLAVGSMAIFAVYLRQRGSPESKPVGAPHHATNVEG